MHRRVNGWVLAWSAVVVVMACSHIPERGSRPALSTETPGEQPSWEQRAAEMGVLMGRVTAQAPPAGGPGGVRPSGPVPGGSSTPVAMAHIGVTPTASSHTWWVVTSVDGLFGIQLPAGTYRLTIQAPSGMGAPKDLPPTVTVTGGQQTFLEIRLDSGLR